MNTSFDTTEYADYLDEHQPADADWLDNIRLSDLVQDQVTVWTALQTGDLT